MPPVTRAAAALLLSVTATPTGLGRERVTTRDERWEASVEGQHPEEAEWMEREYSEGSNSASNAVANRAQGSADAVASNNRHVLTTALKGLRGQERRSARVEIMAQQEYAKKQHQLANRHSKRAHMVHSLSPITSLPSTSTLPSLPVTSTGWSARRPKPETSLLPISELKERAPLLPQVPFDPTTTSPTSIRSGPHVLAARSTLPPPAIQQAITNFLLEVDEFRASAPGAFSLTEPSRGVHDSVIFGVTRTYQNHLHLTRVHKKYRKQTQDLLASASLNVIARWATELVGAHFPKVKQRYTDAKKLLDIPRYHTDSSPDDKWKAPFGIFTLLTINRSKVGPVDVGPHLDYKNPAGGVCVVIPYGIFDSTRKHWLVLWDLGIIIEVPAGVALAFPSALVLHWNCDLVTTAGERPTRANSARFEADGRGSLVFFTQATVLMLAELGRSAKAAREAGQDACYRGLDDIFRFL
ncbi:hypothetical protein P7C70_g4190, partial [Phenoliferia sp. Uapishka_3]